MFLFNRSIDISLRLSENKFGALSLLFAECMKEKRPD